jgi:choice-of-anchor B domain-containing protein
MPLSSFTPTPNSGNSCWGYVSPSSREYALMGLSNQVAVVEITTPASPVIRGSVSHTGSAWCDIKVFGQYAYAVNESGGGLDVIDLGGVDSGVVTLVQRVTTAGLATSHTIYVNLQSGYLYLAGSNLTGGRLRAVSLADPANPSVGANDYFAAGPYCHEAQVVTYTDGPYAGREIAFTSDGGAGFGIVDVTDKANMFLVSRSTYPRLAYCHQGWLSDDRQYFYINDESDGVNETVMFNVSDLAAPVYLGSYSSGLPATDHNQYIRDGYMYESDYNSGLRVFCLENPVAPLQVGWFDTYPENDNSGFNGTWSNYPFFPSGTVIISDINRGLFIVDPAEAITAGAILFGYPDGRPELLGPGGTTRLRVTVNAACNAALAENSPTLHYDTGSGFVAVPMEYLAPGVYDAVFGPIACEAGVRYYVSAQSTLGYTTLDPPGAPVATYAAVSATAALVAASDDFEADLGWTVGDPSSPDTATSGIWNRMDPQPTTAQPGDDHTPGAGTICWVTDGRNGPGVNAFDVDGGKTTLMSPTLDLTGLPGVKISYWRWYSNSVGSNANADVFVVDISNDNGATWVNAETVGPAGPETAGGWIYHEIRVSDFVTPTAQGRLRFVASDLGLASTVEAAIDDFRIFRYDCTVTCLKGDANNDLVVDAKDVASFTDALVSPATPGTVAFCATDMDSDDVLEPLDDLDLFITCLLGGGCP